jgi:aquaporin Z
VIRASQQGLGLCAIEAVGLAVFMIWACLAATALEHPASPLRAALPDAVARRALMGLAMGACAVAIIYSRWGRLSGAHINPGVTLAFLRLGRVRPTLALGYAGAQCLGGLAGVLAGAALGLPLAHPSIDWVATRPGPAGAAAALLAEAAISFVLMLVVLTSSSHPRSEPWTGWLAGACVALFITLEAPISGMSMNPARSLGSALPAGDLRQLWIYFVGPLAGMVAAAEVHARLAAAGSRGCAKLRHCERVPCAFCGRRPSSPAEHDHEEP